jgi:hypothetical protein
VFNRRARVLAVVLVSVLVGLFALAFVTRGAAVTTQTAPNGSAYTVNPGTSSYPYVPLRTPVSISISDSGAGSYGTSSIVACCDGISWSWIGLWGNGALAKGSNVKTLGAYMCFTGWTGQYVRVNTLAGRLQIQNSSAYPVRIYMHW